MSTLQKAVIFSHQASFGASLTSSIDIKKLPFKSVEQARAWLSFMTGDWSFNVPYIEVIT